MTVQNRDFSGVEILQWDQEGRKEKVKGDKYE
jgi:hypothetical protein